MGETKERKQCLCEIERERERLEWKRKRERKARNRGIHPFLSISTYVEPFPDTQFDDHSTSVRYATSFLVISTLIVSPLLILLCVKK